MKLFEIIKNGKRVMEVEFNGWALFWILVMVSIIFG